eukprot:6760385-Pyramimonas_sp.AAC.2
MADRLYYEYWQKLDTITDTTLAVLVPECSDEPNKAVSVPGLVLPGAVKEEEPVEAPDPEPSGQPAKEHDLKVVLRIEYEVENPQTGAHFDGEYMHTNSEVCKPPTTITHDIPICLLVEHSLFPNADVTLAPELSAHQSHDSPSYHH